MINLTKLIQSDSATNDLIHSEFEQKHSTYGDKEFYLNLDLPDLFAENAQNNFSRICADIFSWLDLSLEASTTVEKKLWWIDNRNICQQIIPQLLCCLNEIKIENKPCCTDVLNSLLKACKNPHNRVLIGHLQIEQWVSGVNIFKQDCIALKKIQSTPFEFELKSSFKIDPSTMFNSHEIFVTEFVQQKERDLIISKNNLELIKDYDFWAKSVDHFSKEKLALSKKLKTPHITNAWLKFWEIYQHFDLTNFSGSPIRLFDNASLPGAGVICTIYRAKKYKQQLIWHANSLMPTETNTALEDQYKLYENNKNNWLMNKTMNGDVSVASNIADMSESLNNKKANINLYTSDLGLENSKNWNNQEIDHCICNLGQIYLGLKCLEIDGNFMTKQYTMYSSFSYSIIYILASLFETFCVFKPLTSKPLNSEIYLIGKGFKGVSNDILDLLEFRLENPMITPNVEGKMPCVLSPLPLIDVKLIPEEFKLKYEECLHNLNQTQVMHLDRLFYMAKYSEIKKDKYLFADYLSKEKQTILDAWYKHYNLS